MKLPGLLPWENPMAERILSLRRLSYCAAIVFTDAFIAVC
jgi:hypothetical protein